MGQQMVREQYRLCTLQVRVSRHRGVADFLSAFKQHPLHRENLLNNHADLALGEQTEVGCDLIVPATSGMKFCACWASKVGHATFDGSMNIFIGWDEDECFVTQFGLDCIESRQHRRTLFFGQNSRSGETPDMRARTREVVGGKSRVERKTYGECHQFLCWSAFEPAMPESAHGVLLSVGSGRLTSRPRLNA